MYFKVSYWESFVALIPTSNDLILLAEGNQKYANRAVSTSKKYVHPDNTRARQDAKMVGSFLESIPGLLK